MNTLMDRIKGILNNLYAMERAIEEIQDLSQMKSIPYFECALLRADISRFKIQVLKLKSQLIK